MTQDRKGKCAHKHHATGDSKEEDDNEVLGGEMEPSISKARVTVHSPRQFFELLKLTINNKTFKKI